MICPAINAACLEAGGFSGLYFWPALRRRAAGWEGCAILASESCLGFDPRVHRM